MENTHTTLALSLFNLIPHVTPKKLLTLGIEQDLASKIEEFSLSDIHAIASRAENFLSISINKSVLDQCLKDNERHRDEAELHDEMLARHATFRMMKDLFGMSTSEFCARRKRLGMKGEGQHRPHYCEVEDSLDIYEAWLLYAELDIPQRYLKVSDTTGFSLKVIRQSVEKNEGTG